MLMNYLKIALRNIRRFKLISIIKISGLVVGLSCFILIFLYVRYEKSFDAFHDNSDCIFRVTTQDPGNNALGNDTLATTSAALAPELMAEFPEVKVATRFRSVNRMLLTKGDKSFYERGLYTDEHFFDVFSFRLIQGDKKRILKDPGSIVISSRVAEKFFGKDNPLGETIKCSLGDLTVAGIAENTPENSHIQFDWLISFEQHVRSSIEKGRNPQFFWWGALNCHSYCLLTDESAKKNLEKKIAASMNKKYDDFGWEMKYIFHLQPLKSIHLKSHLVAELSVNSSSRLIFLLSVIAIFILMIACINAMNLSSAHAAKRMKEIGIRKIVGGRRSQIFWQFCGESLLVSFISLFFAVGTAYVLLPGFNRLFGRSIAFGAIVEWPFILGMLFVLVASGFMASLYPAAVLSSIKPVHSLKRNTGMAVAKGGFRNFLVMFQFSITIILIISSLVIFLQIRYIQKRPIGYDREHVMVMKITDPGIQRNFSAFKNSIIKNPKVIEATTSDYPPININNTWGGGKFMSDESEEINLVTKLLWADFNFFDFYRMQIVRGRPFSKEYGTDLETAVMVNEALVRAVGWKDPIGKKFPVWDNQEREIVGVVKDFHFQSLHNEINPLIVFCQPDNNYFQIRIRGENIPETLTFIKNTFENFRTRYPFEYSFLDESFIKLYRSERKSGQLLASFSGLAIFIACLGIFGLASFNAERCTKEIGIRKVLGASVSRIMFLLIRGFSKWIVIANLISWPVAYYAMRKWLQSFAYRIDLGIEIFVFSGLSALVIALITVSCVTLKAAAASPADSLRCE